MSCTPELPVTGKVYIYFRALLQIHKVVFTKGQSEISKGKNLICIDSQYSNGTHKTHTKNFFFLWWAHSIWLEQSTLHAYDIWNGLATQLIDLH